MAVSFREVPVLCENASRFKEITITTGLHTSIEYEERSQERSGSYAYNESNKAGTPVRNRFIYWRACKNSIELVECSLDYNLSQNCLRVRFTDSCALGDVGLFEAGGAVHMLVATPGSVHRLVFPHPQRLQQYDQSYKRAEAEHKMMSIFSEPGSVQKFSHQFKSAGQLSGNVTLATSFLGKDRQALFALATTSGSILLVKLSANPASGGIVEQELKCSSVIQRLWTGLVPGMLRGGAGEAMACTGLVMLHFRNDVFIFAVARDHKLRMWSCKTFECVMAYDLLQYMPDNLDVQRIVLGNEGHLIVKAESDNRANTLLIGLYLSLSDRCQFVVLSPVCEDGVYKMNHHSSLFTKQEKLLALNLTSTHFWSLWTNKDGEAVVKCASINRNSMRTSPWQQVFLDDSLSGEVEVPQHLDPREHYVTEIFSPGRFSVPVILQALNIYQRSLDSTQLSDVIIPVHVLQAEVQAAVDLSIQRAASEYEITEEEYYQLQVQEWSRFYANCVQYQQRASKAVGLMSDARTGLVAVIKKSCVGVLRGTQPAEHLYMSPSEDCFVQDFCAVPTLGDDDALCGDVLALCDCIKVMTSCLTEDMCYFFAQDMYHTQCPEQVARTIVNNLLAEQGAGATEAAAVREMCLQTQSIGDLVQAVECLLLLLDLGQADQGPLEQQSDEEDRQECAARVRSLFASDVSARMLSTCLRQTISVRFQLSRDLLLFLTLATKMAEQAGLRYNVRDRIQAEFLSKAGLLVQVYNVMRWCCDVTATHPPTSLIEWNTRQLEALDLPPSVTVETVAKYAGQSVTTLEMFVSGSGGARLRSALLSCGVTDEDASACWSQGLMPAITCLATNLWPLSGESDWLLFLLQNAQLSQLQEWARLTRGWCEWRAATTRFLLAYTFLNTSEPHKALDCFLEASHGVATDKFLLDLVQSGDAELNNHTVHYFLKVMRLFEAHHLPDLVISLARTAITMADDDQDVIATLWSKIFKQELEMGHSEEAYSAMLANPDSSRRKDCLRQLLVVLCERQELQTLVELPYKDRHVDLEEEVVAILESRARSIDLLRHSYYDLLYSFHVLRGNFRKAGSIMYEFGARLGQEASGLLALQKQAKCYLAALNALRLVDPNNAWIIQPAPQGNQNNAEEEEEKRFLDGEIEIPTKRQVEIVELSSMEREYLLVHARLQLLQQLGDPPAAFTAGRTPGPDHTVGLLLQAGMYDSAVSLCRAFSMQLTAVFDALAARCVKLAEGSSASSLRRGDAGDHSAHAWSWLQHNELPPSNTHADTSGCHAALRLLLSYLERYEAPGDSRHHRAVATKFMAYGFPLPSAFIASYKRCHAAELLRLYVDYDLLEEAGALTLEYIDAVCGRGSEYFGLQTYLQCGAPSVWLPYTCIDQLLLALRDSATDPALSKLYGELLDRMNAYLDTAEEVSADTVETHYRRRDFQARVH